MRSRITRAIVGVTAAVLVALSVPLAVVARHSIVDAEVVELQADAARALAEVRTPLDPDQLRAVAREPDVPTTFQVYGPDGQLLAGGGAAVQDDVLSRALRGDPSSRTSGGTIVVVTPVTSPGSEEVVGAVRLTESLADADRRSAAALAVIVGSGAGALLVAWLVARRVAGRLSRPVVDLAQAAGRLGDGEVLAAHHPVGITEVDLLGDALVASSEQRHEALARERRFSADVSHQLRTPVTGLRLRLEAAAGSTADRRSLEPALEDLRRVEETIDHLLRFARDLTPASATSELSERARHAVERWRETASGQGRTIDLVDPGPIRARGAPTSVDQVLDVLVDNALRHGDGPVDVRVRPMAGGAAVEVGDQGSGTADVDDAELFARGRGADHGIGLALARSLAEAEGGRLLRTSASPTTFTLMLLEPARQSSP